MCIRNRPTNHLLKTLNLPLFLEKNATIMDSKFKVHENKKAVNSFCVTLEFYAYWKSIGYAIERAPTPDPIHTNAHMGCGLSVEIIQA